MAEKYRNKAIPKTKKDQVTKLSDKIKKNKTILIASIKGLPASQFQKIKKNLRGKADVIVTKKSLVDRALKESGKGNILKLKERVGANVAIIFSEMDSFELASLLIDEQTNSKAKAGDIAPEDIKVEPGPTDLMPGPAISELGSVGLKVSVEGGKLAIKQGATIAKEGEVIDEKVASVMGKLNILPMKVGFLPVAAYDSDADMIYEEIKIDKEGTLATLRESIGKALGFARNMGYVVKETITYFISKAAMEEKALEKFVEQKEEKEEENPKEKVEDEKKDTEEEKVEENSEEKKEKKEDAQDKNEKEDM